MELVINGCYGGFGISHEAVLEIARRKGITLYPESEHAGLVWHYYKVPPEQYKALSEECRAAGEGYGRLNAMDWYFSERSLPRDDPDLIAVVRELGEKANGKHADLRIVEIPDGVDYEIDEYDGIEHIAEKHRTWS